MQTEVIGIDSIQQVSGILKELSPKRVLIVSGKTSYELSGAKGSLEKQLEGIDNKRYSDFEENPKFKDLLKGARLAREYNPHLVIAVGGGSVMDTAKVISVLPADETLAEKIVTGEARVPGKMAPLAAIPTTSGSGSEATHFAVAYINQNKYSVASNILLPEYVILDPGLTFSLPPYQTAVSGIDALCQGIESYWAKGATYESRSHAREAIELTLKNLEAAVNRPDPVSRKGMAIAANLAGKAINVSRTTASHALSYAFTTFHGIPHGHAVALTLGEFMVFNTEKALESSDRELMGRMTELFDLFDCEDAQSSRARFRQIMKSIGLEINPQEMSNTKVNIHQIINSVNTERLGNHPVLVSNKDMSRILEEIVNLPNIEI